LKNENFGIKWGLIFGIFGIPIGIITSLYVGIQLEILAKNCQTDVTKLSMWICSFGIMLPICFYFYTLKFRKERQNKALIILFLSLLFFINTLLFYNKYQNSTDGQLIFGLFELPLKTAILYPMIGLLHYKFTKGKQLNS